MSVEGRHDSVGSTHFYWNVQSILLAKTEACCTNKRCSSDLEDISRTRGPGRPRALLQSACGRDFRMVLGVPACVIIGVVTRRSKVGHATTNPRSHYVCHCLPNKNLNCRQVVAETSTILLEARNNWILFHLGPVITECREVFQTLNWKNIHIFMFI